MPNKVETKNNQLLTSNQVEIGQLAYDISKPNDILIRTDQTLFEFDGSQSRVFVRLRDGVSLNYDNKNAKYTQFKLVEGPVTITME